MIHFSSEHTAPAFDPAERPMGPDPRPEAAQSRADDRRRVFLRTVKIPTLEDHLADVTRLHADQEQRFAAIEESRARSPHEANNSIQEYEFRRDVVADLAHRKAQLAAELSTAQAELAEPPAAGPRES